MSHLLQRMIQCLLQTFFWHILQIEFVLIPGFVGHMWHLFRSWLKQVLKIFFGGSISGLIKLTDNL